MSTPRGPERPNQPGPNGPQKESPSRRFGPPWLLWLLLGLILLWNAYSLISPAAAPIASLSYTDFLAQVRAGNVAAVTMKGQNIEGTFKNPTTWPQDGASAPADTGAPTAAPKPTQAAPLIYTRFTTTMPSQGDDRLLPLLEEQGVVISAKDISGGSWFVDLLTSALPILFLLGLLYYMGRQARQGQQAIFGFGGSKARLYSTERPSITFADVAGEEDAKAELIEIVDFLKQPQRYRMLGARLPRGVLLIGPPGTGKTLLARAVAGEARVPFFSISASEFVEMFVGVGASRVRDLFNKAKAAAPAIVFVDEIDAVGRQRGAGLGGGNDEREQTLNQLLVEMDGFDDQTNVIIMAATNRPDVLDPALLRPGRFDRQVTVGLPDRNGRSAILRIHSRPLKVGQDVDLDLLARRTPGFSGADLANLANEAALMAARRGGDEVLMKDFDEALDKILLGTRQASLINEEERRVVAYHESGHALVAKLTAGAGHINKVTIIPRGHALGVTEQFSEEDRRNYSKNYLLGQLGVMLGGRAAEELIFGQPTTGAENDLKQAANLARRMVGLWGMSTDIGAVWYGLGETHPFLGRELGQHREYGEATADQLDSAVRNLVEQSHTRARQILDTHREALDALANELLVHETVDEQKLDALLVAHGITREAISDDKDSEPAGSVQGEAPHG